MSLENLLQISRIGGRKDVFSNVNLDTYDKFYIPYRVVNGNFGNLEV